MCEDFSIKKRFGVIFRATNRPLTVPAGVISISCFTVSSLCDEKLRPEWVFPVDRPQKEKNKVGANSPSHNLATHDKKKELRLKNII